MASRGKVWGVRCGRFAFLLLLVLGLAGLLLSAVAPAAEPPDARGLKRAIEVQNKHSARVLGIKDVAGLGTGVDERGQPVIRVFLKKAEVAGVPNNLEGVPVLVEVTGEFRALAPPAGKGKPGGGGTTIDPKAKWPRPVPIGVSTGNAGECSAGTIGCRLTDGTRLYALSNNHVYARENDGDPGEQVVQPGLYDNKCVPDDSHRIGVLDRFVRIEFGGTKNTVDAAIALLDSGTVDTSTPANGYGVPKSAIMGAEIGQAVQKYGRTTALTKGQVSEINVAVWVAYSAGSAYFENQIRVRSKGAFIRPGDSGSLLVTEDKDVPTNDKRPLGLLFAGNNAGNSAIANRIDLVLDAFKELGVSIDDAPTASP